LPQLQYLIGSRGAEVGNNLIDGHDESALIEAEAVAVPKLATT